MTFNQIDACAKIVQVLARMELPCESKDSPYERADHDLDTLYNLIEEARDILRHGKYTVAAEKSRAPDGSLSASRFIANCDAEDKKLI